MICLLKETSVYIYMKTNIERKLKPKDGLGWYTSHCFANDSLLNLLSGLGPFARRQRTTVITCSTVGKDWINRHAHEGAGSVQRILR